MKIPSDHRADPGWKQFERMVLGGVPHALTIATALSGSSLTVPAAPHFDASEADLAFYGPVHQAYRQCVLVRFLNAMEMLRSHPLWHELKDSRAAQLLMVESCLNGEFDDGDAIVARLQQWFRQSSDDLVQSHARAPAAGAIFRADSRAA